ncbi:lauroyl acyltransferase [Puteibacter caeruleilacunae]|nr:lauroyl acyltransferase [Puteibacter caeruleilacunae]
MEAWWIYGIGLLAQIFFSGRILIQWFMSEKEGRVLSPNIFWEMSLFASSLLLIYGFLRNDFAIVLGQLLVYYIYIRNLQLKSVWEKFPKLVRVVFTILPVIIFGAFLMWAKGNGILEMFSSKQVPMGLLIWGSLGQIVFTFRFVYQWIYSEHQGESVLPAGFWLISIVGSIMIVSYGFFRLDPILILGQGFGLFTYTRNLMLELKGPSKLWEGLFDRLRIRVRQ